MAIKVNGTTVIDDSRNLVNIVSGAGASTTVGAVGTYAFLVEQGVDRTSTLQGETKAGSLLDYAIIKGNGGWETNGVSPDGTWQNMGAYHSTATNNDNPFSVWIRTA